MTKKAKKQILGIAEVSMLGAGSAIGLGAIGGAAATSGQAGIASATRFLPVMGTMTGVGMLMRSMPKYPKRRKKR